MLAEWLDRVIGPPWSGLAMLGILAVPIVLSGYLGVRTVNHFFRDR